MQCYQNVLGPEHSVGTVSIQQARDLETAVDDVEDWSGVWELLILEKLKESISWPLTNIY